MAWAAGSPPRASARHGMARPQHGHGGVPWGAYLEVNPGRKKYPKYRDLAMTHTIRWQIRHQRRKLCGFGPHETFRGSIPPRDPPRGPPRGSPRGSPPRGSPGEPPEDPTGRPPGDPPEDPPEDPPRRSPGGSPEGSPRGPPGDPPREEICKFRFF